MLAAIITMAASCDKEQVGDPYMLFEIHGTVVDTEGNPLKGIHVTSGLSDAQTTNVNGVFTFYGRSAPTSLVVMSFEDRDGEANGGEFANLSMAVQVNEKTPGIAGDNFKVFENDKDAYIQENIFFVRISDKPSIYLDMRWLLWR